MGKPKETVPSPCISVCTIDEDSGLCRGCYRTLEEVSGWPKFSDETKEEVLKRLDERKARIRFERF